MTGRGKGKEVALQTEIESQEDWEENISKEGLLIVDVYQEWCGPCKAMLPNFKRIKNECGDDLLKFAVAKADSVEALERYRGKCEPSFLFYAGGVLVEVVHGADSPALSRAITEQLTNEHKVLEGGATRHEIIDPKFPAGGAKRVHAAEAGTGVVEMESDSDGSSDEEESQARRSFSDMQFGGEQVMFDSPPEASGNGVFVEREFTFCIIKADVVADGKTKDVLQKIRGAGIEVLEELEKTITYDEALEFYTDSYSEELLKIVSSGPSVFLILSKGEFGENIVQEFKEMLGPRNVAAAKESAPKSLRALFAKPDYASNGIHGSDTPADARKEASFFFPSYVTKKVSITHIQPPKEMFTIGIIRSEILAEKRDAIMEKILEKGFKVLMQKEIVMTEEEVENFYKNEVYTAAWPELKISMTSGPSLVLALGNGKETVVEDWLKVIGPKDISTAAAKEPECLRAKYSVPGINVNQFHGSLTVEDAEKEGNYFFPMEQTMLVVKPDAYKSRDSIMHIVRRAGFFVSGRKEFPMSRNDAAEMYRNCAEKDFFEPLLDFMMSGPSCYMILSRKHAVQKLRDLVGPTDIAMEATQTTSSVEVLTENASGDHADKLPESEDKPVQKAEQVHFKHIRQQFGSNILQNAVHASSAVEAAKEEIRMFFGEVQFDEEGCMKKKRKVKKESICEARGKVTTKEDEQDDAVSQKAADDNENENAGKSEQDFGEQTEQMEDEMEQTENGDVQEKPAEQTDEQTEEKMDEQGEENTEEQAEENTDEQVEADRKMDEQAEETTDEQAEEKTDELAENKSELEQTEMSEDVQEQTNKMEDKEGQSSAVESGDGNITHESGDSAQMDPGDDRQEDKEEQSEESEKPAIVDE